MAEVASDGMSCEVMKSSQPQGACVSHPFAFPSQLISALPFCHWGEHLMGSVKDLFLCSHL